MTSKGSSKTLSKKKSIKQTKHRLSYHILEDPTSHIYFLACRKLYHNDPVVAVTKEYNDLTLNDITNPELKKIFKAYDPNLLVYELFHSIATVTTLRDAGYTDIFKKCTNKMCDITYSCLRDTYLYILFNMQDKEKFIPFQKDDDSLTIYPKKSVLTDLDKIIADYQTFIRTPQPGTSPEAQKRHATKISNYAARFDYTNRLQDVKTQEITDYLAMTYVGPYPVSDEEESVFSLGGVHYDSEEELTITGANITSVKQEKSQSSSRKRKRQESSSSSSKRSTRSSYSILHKSKLLHKSMIEQKYDTPIFNEYKDNFGYANLLIINDFVANVISRHATECLEEHVVDHLRTLLLYLSVPAKLTLKQKGRTLIDRFKSICADLESFSLDSRMTNEIKEKLGNGLTVRFHTCISSFLTEDKNNTKSKQVTSETKQSKNEVSSFKCAGGKTSRTVQSNDELEVNTDDDDDEHYNNTEARYNNDSEGDNPVEDKTPSVDNT